MADKDRWIQDALDSWLSPEPGTGPAEDDAWRAKSGYFLSEWKGGGGEPPAPEPAAASSPGSGKDDGNWLADRYEGDRAGLKAAMISFSQRLFYAFPDISAMTISDIATAAAWLTDMEKHVLERSPWALVHRMQGRADYEVEIDTALAELAQMKQAYALQRTRIERGQQAEIARINRESDAFAAKEWEKRRQLWQDTNDEIREMQRQTDLKRQALSDANYEATLRRIRGESVIRIEIER